MKIAVLSGKGGTGKTFVSVNLANAIKNSFYLDCDVEEPNGHLFFKPENIDTKTVYINRPSFNYEKCVGCRKCVDFCKFNALYFAKKRPNVFDDICHYCGGCEIVCEYGAIGKRKIDIGAVEHGTHNSVECITGKMKVGVASGVPIIKSVLDSTKNTEKPVIIDCPPGSACTVMESIEDSDYCVIVAEPTIFGLHNFKMVYELASILKKPIGIIVNKDDGSANPMTEYITKNNLNLLAKIPFTPEIANLTANGNILTECDDFYNNLFADLYKRIKSEVKK